MADYAAQARHAELQETSRLLKEEVFEEIGAQGIEARTPVTELLLDHLVDLHGRRVERPTKIRFEDFLKGRVFPSIEEATNSPEEARFLVAELILAVAESIHRDAKAAL
jgi:hypothetical protein